MGKPSKVLLPLVISTAVIVEFAVAQRNKNCDVRRSTDDANKVDVHCDCMQRLTQMSLAINELTINQTGCSENGLELNWAELETKVSPDVLILAGAQIFFGSNQSGEHWESSIRRLEFIDSEMKEIPSNAFKGMDLLEEVKITGSAVETINTDAFSGLEKLKLVELAKTSITEIEDHAFNNLPSLEDLAFVYCAIGSMNSGAITLLPSQELSRPRCPDVGRSMSEPKEMLEGIMGRSLTSIGNVSLPEYGTRLLFFKNTIIAINSKAINSKTLGFLIVGGNNFMSIDSEAFNMELYNECEISAALFVGNDIDTLNSMAFKGLRGKDGATYQAFIAMANNTFTKVYDHGFQLSNNLIVFAVDQNKFNCDCDNFGWISRNPNSQAGRELEKEIISKAVCHDGSKFTDFHVSCIGGRQTTRPTSAPTTTLPPPTTPDLPDSASAITYSMSLIILVICNLFI